MEGRMSGDDASTFGFEDFRRVKIGSPVGDHLQLFRLIN